jgi:hypothetical protein
MAKSNAIASIARVNAIVTPPNLGERYAKNRSLFVV